MEQSYGSELNELLKHYFCPLSILPEEKKKKVETNAQFLTD